MKKTSPRKRKRLNNTCIKPGHTVCSKSALHVIIVLNQCLFVKFFEGINQSPWYRVFTPRHRLMYRMIWFSIFDTFCPVFSKLFISSLDCITSSKNSDKIKADYEREFEKWGDYILINFCKNLLNVGIFAEFESFWAKHI